MIALTWNARGLRGQQAFCQIQRLVVQASPDLFFVVETSLFNSNASILRAKIYFDNCFYVLFFQDGWDTIGDKITTTALDILNNGGSLKE